MIILEKHIKILLNYPLYLFLKKIEKELNCECEYQKAHDENDIFIFPKIVFKFESESEAAIFKLLYWDDEIFNGVDTQILIELYTFSILKKFI